MVTGPLPPLFPLEVQMRVSPGGTPLPDQLHEEAGHATATTLFGPTRVTVAEFPFPETALKVWGRTVPLEPSWDHGTESLALSPDADVTSESESARAALVMNTRGANVNKTPRKNCHGLLRPVALIGPPRKPKQILSNITNCQQK